MSSQLDLSSLRFNLGYFCCCFYCFGLNLFAAYAYTNWKTNLFGYQSTKQTSNNEREQRFFHRSDVAFGLDFVASTFRPMESLPILIIVCATRQTQLSNDPASAVGCHRHGKRNDDLFPVVQLVCLLASN